MSKMQFKLNKSGVKELLQSDDMQNLLSKTATNIKNRCGDGYEQDILVGKNRANAMVWADTKEAKRENMKNNTLLKAVK